MLTLTQVVGLSCRNLNGNAADWFFQVKQNSGYGSAYVDASNKKQFIAAPDLSLTNSPAVATVNQVKTSTYAIYFNDETASGNQNSSCAHQKGVLAFDPSAKNGFYLLHSTPGWPYEPSKTQQFDSSNYGQHFFCMSIGLTQLEQIAANLYVTRPQIYHDGFNHTWAKTNAPTLYKVLSGEYESAATQTRVEIQTSGGRALTMFYKNAKANLDFWPFVASSFKKDFFVETWLRDSSAIPSCGTYSVEMIGQVKFLSMTWKETQDHSKWGVDASGTVACFGDLNQMSSQMSRGGGAICMQDSSVAGALLGAIVSMDADLVC